MIQQLQYASPQDDSLLKVLQHLRSHHALDWQQGQIYSVFQPILSLANQREVGLEALLRGKLGNEHWSPAQIFAVPETQSPHFHLAHTLLHAASWQKMHKENQWLFLNLDVVHFPQNQLQLLVQALQHLGVRGHQLVIEVVETHVEDEVYLLEFLGVLRGLGCLVAIDDFGAGHSNIDRIWKLEPDIVKLDRGILLEACQSQRGLNILRNLVKLIQEAGSLCLLEGIESQEQALMAMDLGVDLIQGFYFAKPHPQCQQSQAAGVLQSLYPLFKVRQIQHDALRQRRQEQQKALFASAITQEDFSQLLANVRTLALDERVYRAFILNKEGVQLSEDCTKNPPALAHAPITQGQGLQWHNRAYFTQAMARPGEVQVSAPYLSFTDVQLCVTYSIALQVQGETYVLCADMAHVCALGQDDEAWGDQ